MWLTSITTWETHSCIFLASTICRVPLKVQIHFILRLSSVCLHLVNILLKISSKQSQHGARKGTALVAMCPLGISLPSILASESTRQTFIGLFNELKPGFQSFTNFNVECYLNYLFSGLEMLTELLFKEHTRKY